MKSQKLKLIINIVVISLSLFVVSQRSAVRHRTSLFEELMINSVAPMQRSIYFFKERIGFFFRHYVANINASKVNVLLQKNISQLEERIFQYEELARENRRLKELLLFGEEIKSEKVLAQIVSWDASSDFRVLRINKGAKDGIKLQSPVVTAEGLVGYVTRLTKHFAEVSTILDANNRVDGIVQRIRSHGILEGYAKNRCIMKYVNRTEPIILNDTVLTSGLGNIYPKGVQIGTISRIEKESYGITQHIEVTPSVNFGRLEEVIVLVSDSIQTIQREWQELNEELTKNKK